jgi:HD superfamily phosphodiesterase
MTVTGGQNMLVDEILDLAITYNGNDLRRINHLLKVLSFAHHIGVMENCDSQLQKIIDISAILHDIGIHESERKYNSSAGKWQEIEGPIVAQELLKDLHLDNNILNRILWLFREYSGKRVKDVEWRAWKQQIRHAYSTRT